MLLALASLLVASVQGSPILNASSSAVVARASPLNIAAPSSTTPAFTPIPRLMTFSEAEGACQELGLQLASLSDETAGVAAEILADGFLNQVWLAGWNGKSGQQLSLKMKEGTKYEISVVIDSEKMHGALCQPLGTAVNSPVASPVKEKKTEKISRKEADLAKDTVQLDASENGDAVFDVPAAQSEPYDGIGVTPITNFDALTFQEPSAAEEVLPKSNPESLRATPTSTGSPKSPSKSPKAAVVICEGDECTMDAVNVDLDRSSVDIKTKGGRRGNYYYPPRCSSSSSSCSSSSSSSSCSSSSSSSSCSSSSSSSSSSCGRNRRRNKCGRRRRRNNRRYYRNRRSSSSSSCSSSSSSSSCRDSVGLSRSSCSSSSSSSSSSCSSSSSSCRGGRFRRTVKIPSKGK